jgi:hypothetical protein
MFTGSADIAAAGRSTAYVGGLKGLYERKFEFCIIRIPEVIYGAPCIQALLIYFMKTKKLQN